MDYKRSLIIVDPQNDFITGTLAVPGAFKAMTDLANHIEEEGSMYDVIYVTQDWHPIDHCSFEDNGGKWPVHCVIDTYGAEVFTPLKRALSKHPNVINVYKGADKTKEEYGASIDYLYTKNLYICGIAEDYCVNETYLNLVNNCSNTIDNITYLPYFSAKINNIPMLPINTIKK